MLSTWQWRWAITSGHYISENWRFSKRCDWWGCMDKRWGQRWDIVRYSLVSPGQLKPIGWLDLTQAFKYCRDTPHPPKKKTERYLSIGTWPPIDSFTPGTKLPKWQSWDSQMNAWLNMVCVHGCCIKRKRKGATVMMSHLFLTMLLRALYAAS